MPLPASLGLVLRDRTRADGVEVLCTALEDLVAAGAWELVEERRRLRGARRSLVAGAARTDLPAPLGFVDGLLRKGAAGEDLETTARWFAEAYRRAPGALVQQAIAWLLEQELLEEVGEARRVAGVEAAGRRRAPTPAGEAALAAVPNRPSRDAEYAPATTVAQAFARAYAEVPERRDHDSGGSHGTGGYGDGGLSGGL